MSDKLILLSIPNIKGNELQYVSILVEKVLVLTDDPCVNGFGKEVSEYDNCKGALNCQNGTSGLDVAPGVNGIKKDDGGIAYSVNASNVIVTDIPKYGISKDHPATVFRNRDTWHYNKLKKVNEISLILK